MAAVLVPSADDKDHREDGAGCDDGGPSGSGAEPGDEAGERGIVLPGPVQDGEFGDDLVRQASGSAEFADGEAGRAFGEALAGDVADQ